MEPTHIFRKRIIPSECILLKEDEIIKANHDVVITRWKTLHPKKEFSHGCSCYFLNRGIKVSKFYRHDGSLLYWYCDIVDYEFLEDSQALSVTDLLADVIIYPDGTINVVDLDELAGALEKGLISDSQMCCCLRRLNDLLTLIYRNEFDSLQNELEKLE